jgi:CheY-like chemotaxis protein
MDMTASTPPGGEPSGHKILLVEDHKDTAKVMQRLLRGFNYQVEIAESVQSALQAAGQNKFDLVISDLGLPDGNGLDLMKQLRQMYPIKGIALSGYGMDDDVQKSLSAGFAKHLIKPVNLDQLKDAIEQVTG